MHSIYEDEIHDMREIISERSVDFYIKHKVSPVTRDISKLEVYFEKRESLFRHLGIIPSFLADKTVLEFGPGGGHNSIYTLGLKPTRYVLVDGNKTGLASVEHLFQKNLNGVTQYELVESFIEDFSTQEKFDLVICENVIPLQQNDPAHVLRCVADYVKPGGLLVITCMDPVSFFADVLGHLAGELIVRPEMTTQEKLDAMRPFFQMKLDAIPGANTIVDDFMMDSIIQHYPENGKMQTISDTVNELSNTFDVYGSSPHFLIDWRWYKNIHGDQALFNKRAIDLYDTNIYNLLDYRCELKEIESRENTLVRKLCNSVFEATKKFRKDRQLIYIKSIRCNVNQLANIACKYSQCTADSLNDFIGGIDAYLTNKPWPRLEKFAPFCGRGTQYLSFIRKHTVRRSEDDTPGHER